MRRYFILQPFILAFYAKSLYRDVRSNWHGAVFAYLFFLAALCAIPTAHHLHQRIQHFAHSLQPWFKQWPTLTIQNETVSIDKPVPYYIKNPSTGQPFVVIDTSEPTLAFKDSTAQILLTQKQLSIKQSTGEIKTYALTGLRNQRFSAEGIEQFSNRAAVLSIYLIYPLLLILYFLRGIFAALFYAALAKLFIKTTLTYNEIFRLSAIALTPKFMLIALFDFLAITVPYAWLLYFALGMAYVFYAIEASRQEAPAV